MYVTLKGVKNISYKSFNIKHIRQIYENINICNI